MPVKRLKVSETQSKPILKTPFPQDADENFNGSSDSEEEKDESEEKKSEDN